MEHKHSFSVPTTQFGVVPYTTTHDHEGSERLHEHQVMDYSSLAGPKYVIMEANFHDDIFEDVSNATDS